jgi:hypothetical protein
MNQGIKDGYNQGSPRYLAPGALTLKILKILGGGINSSDSMDNYGEVPPLRFSLKFLKKLRGEFYLGPSL